MICVPFFSSLLCSLGRRWPFQRGKTFLYRIFSKIPFSKGYLCCVKLKGSDVTISLPLEDDSAKRLALFAEDDRNLFKFLLRSAEENKGIFLDVGAHYGAYALRIAKNTGSQVLAIEPQPLLASYLRKNAIKNGVEDLVVVHEVIAGAKLQQVAFFESPTDSATSKVEADGEGETWRPMMPLSELISLETWKKVSLVKVDVEGYEQEVFLGLLSHLQRHTPLIVFEANSNELSQRGKSLIDAISILKEVGYREFFLVREKLASLESAFSVVENVFAKPPLTNSNLAY